MKNISINKIKISKSLSSKTGLSISFSKKLNDSLIKIIIHNIIQDNFNLKNIGTFKLINKEERIGRNPKTKIEHIISRRKVIKFISSKNLNKRINLENE